MPLDVHPDGAGLQHRGDHVALLLSIPAQYRPYPGQQLPGREGFRDIVVGAELQPHDLVDLGVLGRDHDDRNVGALSDLATYFRSRHTGQHQVKQNEISAASIELLNGSVTRVRHGNVVTLLAQHVGQGIAEGILVLDHEHSGHSVSSRMSVAAPQSDSGAALVMFPDRTGSNGRLSVNVDPVPGTLQTCTSPPWEAAMCFTMDKPRPVPPVALDRAGSMR